MFYLKGEYESAIEQYHNCIVLYEEIQEWNALANTHNNIGNVYSEQGNYPKSLEAYQSCLHYKGKTKNKAALAGTMSNIGLVHYYVGNFEKAMEYFQKGYALQDKIGDREGSAMSLNNIGMIYHEQKEYTKALDSYQKSLAIAEEINDWYSCANSLNNMGTVFEILKDYNNALVYFKKSLEMELKIENHEGIATSLSNLGSVYVKINQAARARPFASKAFIMAQSIGHLESMKSATAVLYKADSALGNWKDAFEALKQNRLYSDSLNNDEKSREIGRLESKYAFEKKAEEDKAREQELVRVTAEKRERRNDLQYLIIFAALIGLFSAFVFIGRFQISESVLNISLMALMLLLFEFLLVVFDPFIDTYTEGIPFYKLLFNSGIAFLFAPLHARSVALLRKRMIRAG